MIALIGYMGSGKSVLAVELANRLDLELYEIDQMVCQLSGLPDMQAIFDKGGEEYLRALELETVQSLKDQKKAIIDGGGGLITYEPSNEILQKICKSIIYLRVPFELAQKRVGNDKNRPLFADTEAARERYEQRQTIYEKAATDIVEIHGQTVEELADQVEELMS
ncbi:hypothetical protein KA529_03790 [Candidatus Saccharibacteria bacterium]|nr:hypothetical protein [Candidatus Saccharibacteria bacterium]